jgi:hypothetical protein
MRALRRIGDLPAIVALPLVVALIVAGVYVSAAFGAAMATKKKLPRDNIYFEITNDGGDHGNFIETIHVPFDGRTYRCIIYSDQIQSSGGGAGMWCERVES